MPMLFSCARNVRCAKLAARTTNVYCQRLLSSSATGVQRLVVENSGKPATVLFSALSCPSGFVNVTDFLDEVFPSLNLKSGSPRRCSDVKSTIIERIAKPKKVPTVRTNDELSSVKFLKLVERLKTYRLPKVDDVGEAIVDPQLNECNAALLSNIRPLILKVLRNEPNISGCLRLLDIMTLKNVRDEEIVTAVYDALVRCDTHFSAGRLAKMAVCYAKLGIQHDDALERIRDDLVHLMHFPLSAVNHTAEITRTVVSLARARMGSVLHWTVYANWTKEHFEEIPFLHQLTLLNAFAIMSSPLLDGNWSKVTRALVSEQLDPMFVFTNAYNATTAFELTPDLAKRVLCLSSMKMLLPPADASVVSSLSMFTALRFWQISAYEAFIRKRNVKQNVAICRYINDFVKANENRTALFWRVKYSKDMSSVDAFRQLLHDVAPLGTHSMPPHIHPERGVCVEANVYVHRGRILSLKDAQLILESGGKPIIVSVLYFMKSHMLTMTSGQGGHNSVLRLDGRSNLSVQLMKAPPCTKSLSTTQLVVFTELDLRALADDELRRKYIRKHIERLSKRYLDAKWPVGLVGRERNIS